MSGYLLCQPSFCETIIMRIVALWDSRRSSLPITTDQAEMGPSGLNVADDIAATVLVVLRRALGGRTGSTSPTKPEGSFRSAHEKPRCSGVRPPWAIPGAEESALGMDEAPVAPPRAIPPGTDLDS